MSTAFTALRLLLPIIALAAVAHAHDVVLDPGGCTPQEELSSSATLVECEAQTNLRWRADDGQFTVLTPSFEDWTEYLSTVAILILFFGFLLANAGNFG